MIHTTGNSKFNSKIMTQEEGNILIADFLSQLKGFAGAEYSKDPLQYHTSWEWLMPVVQKISFYHTAGKVNRADMGEADKIFSLYLMTPIETVWQAVIQFIQWYNEQSK